MKSAPAIMQTRLARATLRSVFNTPVAVQKSRISS